ncbi:amino acid/amide ABC transporter ATP-binding protein 2, HAAT family [Thermomonospora echinospora]|uniref:Amino acid/amide ABC transporter ATP-binding protein 2, HAAT family n=1 Tax=Thermomonospora echinospora TaxID=1992 RepID=A0A1H6E5D2_9ACTN|nr:ATP-binding cassette domain-containing protein [Thermomonospora echinospora]SEG92968.1 amino acid/amide ABC transporter ATP-binding protein 2, HAAT family [Thermomonospora echinospora]
MRSVLLTVEGMSAGYSGVDVVRELDLTIDKGEVVALLGPNGAGKTTTLLALAGVLTPTSGKVRYRDAPLRGALHRRARRGISYISEQGSVFSRLTTLANLRLGPGPVEDALALFPELEPLLGRRGGLLSGGEQRMLALARSLAGKPDLLLVDELSLGLAPLIVTRLLERLRAAADAGTAVLIVEQHASQVLAVSDRGYVLRRGRLSTSGTGAELLASPDVLRSAYLGTGPG